MRTFLSLMLIYFLMWIEGFLELWSGVDYTVPDLSLMVELMFVIWFIVVGAQDIKELFRKN